MIEILLACFKKNNYIMISYCKSENKAKLTQHLQTAVMDKFEKEKEPKMSNIYKLQNFKNPNKNVKKCTKLKSSQKRNFSLLQSMSENKRNQFSTCFIKKNKKN